MKRLRYFVSPIATLLRLLPFVLLCSCLSAMATAQDDWSQFRGPGSRGVAAGENLPVRWSTTENVKWKIDLPGRGWSSPIVHAQRVFVSTVVNLGESEPPKKGLYFGGNRPEPPLSEHQWKVFCLDLETGREIWQRQVHEGVPTSPIHLKNSYASETPVTDGERLYVYFGNVGVFCLDLDGQEIWTKRLEPRPTRYGWGTAASPVLDGERLYLVNDNDEDSYLLALDKNTGEEVWRVERDEKSNWATPFIWRNDVRTEIVTPGTGKVRSYGLDGKLLWSLVGMSSITIATPYEYGGLLYISSGYVMDKQRPIYAIRPGASGDISLGEEETSNDWIAWSNPEAGPYNPSTLVYHDRLYVLLDRGFLACYRAEDGSVLYDRQRIPNGRAFTASPWAYEDKVFCLNEDGVTFVFRDADEFELLHSNTLADDDMCMATPAVAGDNLLVRTAARVYCIAEGATPDDAAFGRQVSDTGVRHSFLITGSRTAIIDEQSRIAWEVSRSSRDGCVLPGGNVLVSHGDEAVEYTPAGETVFRYRLHPDNQELGTAVRLPGGNTLLVERGPRPRLVEVDSRGQVQHEVPLQPESDNAHMQTRMARRLPNGNYLVPHLLAFAVKEYAPDGTVVDVLRTDLPELGGRAAENWPFTAIRLENGNTLVNLTHGNKTVELDAQGRVVWRVDNADVQNRFADPCGGQRLPNGNTVICSYGQQDPEMAKVFEVTRDKQVVWEYVNPELRGIHEIHVLTTNGQPVPWPPAK